MQKYRRTGLGTWAATRLFDHFQGRWKVTQISSNIPAQAFGEKSLKLIRAADMRNILIRFATILRNISIPRIVSRILRNVPLFAYKIWFTDQCLGGIRMYLPSFHLEGKKLLLQGLDAGSDAP